MSNQKINGGIWSDTSQNMKVTTKLFVLQFKSKIGPLKRVKLSHFKLEWNKICKEGL